MLGLQILLPVILAMAALTLPGVHKGGALLSVITEPGIHLKLPVITRFDEIQVTVQTDHVVDIPCGTSGGSMITFDKIEVVNRLKKELAYETVKNYTVHYDKTVIFDKIHHEINQFCSRHTLREVYIDLFDTLDDALAKALQTDCDKWAPGVEIIAVRVTKPRIPEQIRRNFEQMEVEKTRFVIAQETQKVVEKEAETEKRRATIEAQKNAEVSRINMQREIEEKEAHQKIAVIMDEMHYHKEKMKADAEAYKTKLEAEANKARLTQEFLRYSEIQALAANRKIYYGERIPSVFVNSEALGSLSTQPSGDSKE